MGWSLNSGLGGFCSLIEVQLVYNMTLVSGVPSDSLFIYYAAFKLNTK